MTASTTEAALRELVRQSLTVGAPGLAEPIREAIVRSIVLKAAGKVLAPLLADRDRLSAALATACAEGEALRARVERAEAALRMKEDEPSPEEIEAMRVEAENFRLPAPSPILVREPFYLTKCRSCGWVGSSEQCGTDSFGDDSDVYCPVCFDSGCEQKPSAEEVAEHLRAARSALAQPEQEGQTR